MVKRTLEDVLAAILREDPDLLAAADEVDRDLLDWFATLPLEERLDRALRMAREYEEIRDGAQPR